jgi:hypothetical protein
MKIFGKHISASFSLAQTGEDVLFGINVCNGTTECCGDSIIITRIGVGFGEIDVFLQNDHKH